MKASTTTTGSRSGSRQLLLTTVLVLASAGGTYLAMRPAKHTSEAIEASGAHAASVRASSMREARAAAIETAALTERLARLEERVSAAERTHEEVAAEAQEAAADTASDDLPDEPRRPTGTPSQIHKALEATWTDEPTDTSWSRQEERAIAAALGTSPGSTVARRIECRSSMCKVALGFKDGDARARFEAETLGHAPFDRGVFVHNDNAVGTEVSLYAMRDVPQAP